LLHFLVVAAKCMDHSKLYRTNQEYQDPFEQVINRAKVFSTKSRALINFQLFVRTSNIISGNSLPTLQSAD